MSQQPGHHSILDQSTQDHHAAAHKHVPLMENNCIEAVENNVFGTRNLLESASAHGVERLVQAGASLIVVSDIVESKYAVCNSTACYDAFFSQVIYQIHIQVRRTIGF